jgi:hypothetical protein
VSRAKHTDSNIQDVSVLKVGSVKPFRDGSGNEEEIAGLEQLDSVEGWSLLSLPFMLTCKLT